MVLGSKPQAKAAWVVDPVHTNVEFAAKHMMVATVRGRFTKFAIDLQLDEAHHERHYPTETDF